MKNLTNIRPGNGMVVRLQDLLDKQEHDRGLTPLPLEKDALLRRVSALDWSGRFLGQAFLSTYSVGKKFEWSLGEIINLDAEGFRLFHTVLHMRHTHCWRDDALYDIAQEIKSILKKGGFNV